MILTQREGTAATKIPDQSMATVTSEGKLVASQAKNVSIDNEEIFQAASETSHVMLDRMKEPTGRTTPFRYEDGVLCATFPEMGVTLNSMVDRRQLATRYAAQVEVAVNIDNKLIVHQVGGPTGQTTRCPDGPVPRLPDRDHQRPDRAPPPLHLLGQTSRHRRAIRPFAYISIASCSFRRVWKYPWSRRCDGENFR